MSAYVRGEEAPQAGPRYRVLQLGQGEGIDAVILSPAMWGVVTHWNQFAGKKGRSERCTKAHGNCEGCDRKMPKRWKGYLWVMPFHRKACVFIELTPQTKEDIIAQMPEGTPLRGQRIQIKRGDGGPKTALRVCIQEWRGDIENLPPDVDPEPVLEMLWNWQR